MLCAVLLLCVFGTAWSQPGNVQPLDTYNVDKTSITASGGSSGGFMTGQMHVAFSSKFSGAAIIAGGPYFCAEGDVIKAGACGVNADSIDAARLASLTLEMASRGEIDNTANLANDKVWIFHGALDSVVDPNVGTKIQEYYSYFGITGTNVYLDMSFPAQHSLPTEDRGGECDRLNHAEAYLNLCGYEAAYELLEYLYGGLIRAASNTPLNGQYYYFDQNEFISLPTGSSMDSSGAIYVPSGCVDKSNQCRLHVVFHGCNQGKYVQEDKFTLGSGFCQIGELNNIIMLFPQADLSVENPQGCWDWWGYNDPIGSEGQYATRNGRQTEACARMVDRVAGF